MKNFALTIQGGWTGTGFGVNQLNPSEFNASLSINNWLAPVTINDILVTGVSAPLQDASLYIRSTKNITLNRVQVVDNTASGIRGAILSTSDAPLGAPAAVTVNNSVFNHNPGDGLVIYADGAVKIKNLTANFNGTVDGIVDYGANIYNTYDNPDQPVTLAGTNEFKGNLGTGLNISSSGAVTLNNITAYKNDDGSNGGGGDGYGVYIDNTNDSTASNVSLTGANRMDDNQLTGLEIRSNGNIKTNNLSTNNNGNSVSWGGAYLDNCLSLSGTCLVNGKSVTLSGVSNFNGNSSDALYVLSGGAITVYQISAADNDHGASIDNFRSSIPYPVTVYGPGTFLRTEPDDGALIIFASGAVSLKNITSNSNGGYGIDVHNDYNSLSPQNVTISGVNEFNDNVWGGALIYSYGAVTLSNITANGNGIDNASDEYGVYIDNGALNKPVTLTGLNRFKDNLGSGLWIESSGMVTLNNVTASYNDDGTDGGGGDGYGVYIDNTNDGTASNVTLNGANRAGFNQLSGMEVYGNGNILLNNLAADDNGVYGVYIGTSGQVYLKNISASRNLFGATIVNNTNLLAPQNVTISGVNEFNDNVYDGAVIYSFGAITLSNIAANGNGQVGSTGYGVYLANYAYDANAGGAGVPGSVLVTRKPVTISGMNAFNGNYSGGLYVYSMGTITISGLIASGNGHDELVGGNHIGVGDGVHLQNQFEWYPNFGALTPYGAGVTIFGYGTFESNQDDGLEILSKGLVNLKNITANGNGEYGAYIEARGDSALTAANVVVSGTNSFSYNGFLGYLVSGQGLYVMNDGAITLSNLSVIRNQGQGVWLDNSTLAWTGKHLGITLSGFNTFQNNYWIGLTFNTDGNVILSHVNADGNLWKGVEGYTSQNLTLMCGSAYGNANSGFSLGSGLTMTLFGYQSYYNGAADLLPPTALRYPCP
jgi:hypothetical protein